MNKRKLLSWRTQRQAVQGEFRSTAQACEGAVRKAKAHLKLTLARAIRRISTAAIAIKCCTGKHGPAAQSRRVFRLRLRDLMPSLHQASPTVYQGSVLSEGVWGGFWTTNRGWGLSQGLIDRTWLRQVYWIIGLHPWVLRAVGELPKMVTPFTVHGNWKRSPKAGERHTSNSSSKKAKMVMSAPQPHFGNWENNGLNPLGEHFWAHGGGVGDWEWQCGFTKGKICLTLWMAFCDKMTGFADGERTGNVVYHDFSKGFNSVSQNILLPTLGC